jgi:outer membrane lipase/esterase
VAFNKQLETNLQSLEQNPNNPGIVIHRVDIYSLLNEVLANPAAFGFSPALANLDALDLWLALGGDPMNLPTGNGFIFWDGVHPTSAVNDLIAQRALTSLPEPSTLTLGLMIAAGLWVGRRFLPAKPLAA